MNFTVVPDSKRIGNIEARSLKEAIGMKHCLYAKLGMTSTIKDKDGFLVSELEQSTYIFDAFL